MAATNAPSPTRTNCATPLRPPNVDAVLDDDVTRELHAVRRGRSREPTTQSCATCAPTMKRLLVADARRRVPRSRRAPSRARGRRCPRPPRAAPGRPSWRLACGSPPTTANGWTTHRGPSDVGPRTTACAWRTHPSASAHARLDDRVRPDDARPRPARRADRRSAVGWTVRVRGIASPVAVDRRSREARRSRTASRRPTPRP